MPDPLPVEPVLPLEPVLPVEPVPLPFLRAFPALVWLLPLPVPRVPIVSFAELPAPVVSLEPRPVEPVPDPLEPEPAPVVPEPVLPVVLDPVP